MRSLAGIVVFLLLLLLAFRLTATETLRDPFAQKLADVTAKPEEALPPEVGPVFTASYAAICFALAGLAAFLAARAQCFSRRRSLELVLIAVALALAMISSFHAANRFVAFIGTADLAASLAAAFALSFLCNDELLGHRARHIALAAILAILVTGCAKALMQHFIEFPDMLNAMNEDPQKAFRMLGMANDPAQQTLYLSRVKSAEVSGFGGLSNVFATQMIACVGLLAALVAASIPLLRLYAVPVERAPSTGRASNPAARQSPKNRPDTVQIPMHILGFAAATVLLVVSLAILPMTQSKGGSAAAIIAGVALSAGGLWWKRLLPWRKPLIALTVAAILAGGIAVVLYGSHFDRLPTRSLQFRWHYWTASIPVIKQSPTWGVGLNNFGDYYDQFKRPSSPEDVKDPHNFFIRLVAELGLPATAVILLLLVLRIQGALRPSSVGMRMSGPAPHVSAPAGPLLLGAVLTLLWIIAHLVFTETINDFSIMMTCIYGVFGWAVFAGIFVLIESLYEGGRTHPLIPGTRFLTFAAMVCALAMLLYDQVNMALVTGPAAMLFWMLLALGDSHDPPIATSGKTSSPAPRMQPVAVPLAISGILVLASLAILVFIVIPLANQSFDPDPAPYEYAAIHHLLARDNSAALGSLDAALVRAPRSMDLHWNRALLLRELGMKDSFIKEARRILDLDRANARPRVDLALPPSDLPKSERIAALRDALAFDRELAEGEPKRLTSEQVAEIQATIRQLEQ